MQQFNARRHNVPYIPQQKPLRLPLPLALVRKSGASPADVEPLMARLAAQDGRLAELEATLANHRVEIDDLKAEVRRLLDLAEARLKIIEMNEELLKQWDNGLTMLDLLKIVADASALPVALLQGPRRTRTLAQPRQMYFWLAKTHTPLASLPSIGRSLGDRDHTTVLHGIRRVEERIAAGDTEAVALRNACMARIEALIKERAAA